MPRLTRTQKFADLRDQLTTDSEPTLKTEQNSQYDDRLSKLQGFSSVEQPAYQQPQQPFFQQPVQETSPLDDLMSSVNNTFDSFINNQAVDQTPITPSFDDDMFDSLFNTNNNNSTYGGTPLDFSILDQKEEKTETNIQSNFDNLSTNIINDIIEAETASEYEETPVEVTPTYEEASAEETPIVEAPVEAVPTYEETPVVEAPVEVAPIVETPVETAPIQEEVPVEETPVEETLDDQLIYDFNPTDEIVSFFAEEPKTEETQQTLVYDDSHFDTPSFEETQVEESQVEETQVEETQVEETVSEFVEVPVEANDEEFSNTVSLEISKIIDDLSVVEQREATQEIEATKIIEKVEEVKPVIPVVEDKDAVIIKNIAEMEAATEGTMSDTIPFIVENKETEVEEEEEEGSNVILNIILIVLIIVLIAVLGLIVYYILKTKGIL